MKKLRVCEQKRMEVKPAMLLCLCLESKPWYLLLQGNLLCKEPPGSVLHGSSPRWPLQPGRCSVDGSKLCFSVISFYVLDLGLHMLQSMWNISVDCCTARCVQSSSMTAQPQAYNGKYQHWQILNAEICPAFCSLTDISEEEHLSASLKTWALRTVKYLLNSVCINGNEGYI